MRRSEMSAARLKLRHALLLIALLYIFPAVRQPSAIAQAGEEEQIFARAVRLHQSGDIERAIYEYMAFLAVRPDRSDARSNLGAAYASLGRYEEAIEQYKQALAIDDDNAAIRFNLALAFYKAAYIPEAATELARIVYSEPGNMNAVLLLAECQLRMGEFKKTIDLLTPLESAKPEDRTVAYLLGSALMQDKQLERGQLLLDRIFRADDSPEAHILMGTAHLTAGDFPSALKELERALSLNPKLPVAHSLFGQAALRTGDNDKAMQAFRTELELNPNDFESNLYTGILVKGEGRNDEALGKLRRAAMVRPRDLRPRYYIGTVYLNMGKTAEAGHLLEEVLNEAPEFMEAHVMLAMAYYRLKRKEDGDRERALAEKLASERQAHEPGTKQGSGPPYRGEKVPAVAAPPRSQDWKPE